MVLETKHHVGYFQAPTKSSAPSQKQCLTHIDGKWYDLTKWASSHPGGEQILHHFDGHDSTDAFFSLHSEAAIKRLGKFAPVDVKQEMPPANKLDTEYRKFVQELKAQGFWERSLFGELRVLVPTVTLWLAGLYLSWSNPLLAIVLLGVAQQQAGWLGHDMTHARNSDYNDTMLPLISGWINGFDRWWWSDKHNTHHVLTNHVDLDPDIDNRPFLFLWAQTKETDSHYRKYQHIYAWPLYTFLYISWRIQSFQTAYARRDWKTIFAVLAPGYVILALLPWYVAVGSQLLSGVLVAVVVTVSHESEEMLFHREESFVLNQFRGTKDIICPDPFTEFLFGGMQYQLEHHLFPTIPRYYYPRIRPLVQQWAQKVGIEYKSDGLLDTLRVHHATLKMNALRARADE